jgi:hypothetical protein
MLRHSTPVLAAVLLLLGVVGPARANLVVNGGFETGDFTGWSVNGNFLVVEQGGISYFGGPSLVPHGGISFAAFGSYPTPGSISQTLATIAGDTYEVNWFLASNGTTPNEFGAQFGSRTLFDETDIPANSVIGDTYTYTEYSYEVVASSDSTTLTFYGLNEPSYLALDDVSVNAVREPTSVALVAVGAGCLFGHSRRRRPVNLRAHAGGTGGGQA